MGLTPTEWLTMASLREASLLNIATAIFLPLIATPVLWIIYNLFFHPLRKYPGPLLFRATRLPWVWRHCSGLLYSDVLKFHNQYGPIVRVAPDELAFLDPAAWKTIYGHRPGGGEMGRAPAMYHTKAWPTSIVGEPKDKHSVLRRAMAPGFSERSMRQQEPIIQSYVDLLMKRLRTHSEGGAFAVDMRAWLNFATFDLIGDLAFGDSFGCLENSDYHPWVGLIQKAFKGAAVIHSMRLLGLEPLFLPLLKLMTSWQAESRVHLVKLLDQRIALKDGRPDFMEGLLANKDSWGMTREKLEANADLMVVAGSETSATVLTGATYLILSTPGVLEKLTQEVRGTFEREEDITFLEVGRLRYLNACLEETLRHYPAISGGLPRIVPPGGAEIAGTFVPAGMTVACWHWAMYHSDKNWEDPFSYRPERFLDGHKSSKDRLDSLNPFSYGPRDCIGRNLAYAEMRVILARLVFTFDLKLAKPEVNWLDQKSFQMWDKPDLPVYLTSVAR